MSKKDIQSVSLEILKDIHEFCVKNNLKYSLSGGTLLGAIRHNGFIPWDDDIDIQMPWNDYLYFIHHYQSTKGYKVFSSLVDGCEYTRLRLAKVCDITKTKVDFGPLKFTNEDVGIFVDVQPCVGAPNNVIDAQKFMEKLATRLRMAYCYATRYIKWRDILKYESSLKRLKTFVFKFFSPFVGKKSYMKFLKLQSSYDYDSSEYFIASPHYKMREWQPKQNMENFELQRFEDSDFYIMSGWDANLKSLYGDYMKLPPENERVAHDFFRYYWK